MWLRKTRSEELAPQGVRVRQADDSVVECDVFRDPESDRDGCAVWVAVPRDNVALIPGTVVIELDVLPENTIVELAAWVDK